MNTIALTPSRNRFTTGVIRTFLADDSPLMLAVVGRLLQRDERITIVGSAPDGVKAFYNASMLQLDLVLTDLHMPGWDGAELTRQLKQLPNSPAVFVVTSDDSSETREKCLAAGADAFLIKINLPLQLQAAIGEFFGQAPASIPLKTPRQVSETNCRPCKRARRAFVVKKR